VTSTFATALVVTSLRLVASHAYADGAPTGFSGGFKEDSCHACHFHAEPNSGPGSVTIEGVPPTFAPGKPYPVTITLRRPGMKLAGFQLTTRAADSGVQAGGIAPGAGDSERVGVEISGGVHYAGHKKAGTAVTADAASWTIVWTAPTSSGPVAFHVSANAADGNESADGDFVYTATAQSAPLTPDRR
jgi:hypothetical protein